MYPLKELIVAQAEKEILAIREILHVAVLALEVERGAMSDKMQGVDEDLQAILGLGVLLSDLQTQRTRAQKLCSQLPSPNQVAKKLRERVATATQDLFDTVELIRNTQREIYRLARLNLRAASHKINATTTTSKVRAKVLAGSN